MYTCVFGSIMLGGCIEPPFSFGSVHCPCLVMFRLVAACNLSIRRSTACGCIKSPTDLLSLLLHWRVPFLVMVQRSSCLVVASGLLCSLPVYARGTREIMLSGCIKPSFAPCRVQYPYMARRTFRLMVAWNLPTFSVVASRKMCTGTFESRGHCRYFSLWPELDFDLL